MILLSGLVLMLGIGWELEEGMKVGLCVRGCCISRNCGLFFVLGLCRRRRGLVRKRVGVNGFSMLRFTSPISSNP